MTGKLVVAALLVFLQWRSGIEAWPLTVAVVAVFAYVTLTGGRLLATAAGVRDGDPASAWVLGLLALCLGIYGLTLLLPVTAGAAFAAISAVVIALRFVLRRRQHFPEPDGRALIGFALAAALTALWCSEPAGAYAAARSHGVLPAWQDYFIHGGLISQLGDARALGRGSIFLADFPPSFYHFASYAGAAALAGPLDRPGLPLATSAWLPLGFLAMAAGALALGQRLAGPAGGLAALAAVAILPDASNYGLRNGLFSFQWMLVSHPGADYALAAAFASLALLDRWNAERSRAALAASLMLAASVFLFRAQFFLLFFVPWLATAAFCSLRGGSRMALAGLSLTALLVAAAAALYLLIPELEAAGWRVRLGSLEVFLDVMHNSQEPTAYTGLYRELADQGRAIALWTGVGLTLVAALGAFVILLPAALVLGQRFAALRPIDAFVAYVVLWWLLLMVVAPEPWIGEGTNLLFQPFPLVYAAAAIWTVCLLVRCLVVRALWAAILGAALVALVPLAIAAERLAHPKFAWGQEGAAQRLEPGLVPAAAFLRANAARGDIFASSGLRADFQLFDLSTQLCSLTGMPAYLSRAYLEMIKGEPRKALVGARLAALQEVERQTGYDEAMRLLRGTPVRWYVSAGERGPLWDPGRARAAFKSGTVAVYRIP